MSAQITTLADRVAGTAARVATAEQACDVLDAAAADGRRDLESARRDHAAALSALHHATRPHPAITPETVAEWGAAFEAAAIPKETPRERKNRKLRESRAKKRK